MRFIKGIGRFWYDFVIGDDWKIACAVVLVLAVGAVVAHADVLDPVLLTALLTGGLLAAFAVSMVIDVRRRART